MTLSLVSKIEEIAAPKKELVFPEFTKKEIYDANGNVISGFSAVTNVENEEVSSVMSSRYTIVNHEKAFEHMDRAAKNFCPSISSEPQFENNGARMKVIYDLPQQFNINVADGDPLQTRLVGYNSVDGSKCLSFHIDFKRLVCANGMVGFSREFSFTRKHSANIENDIYEFDIAAQTKYAWEAVVANANKLKNNAVNFDEGMEAIKAMVDRKLFPKKMQNWIESEWRRATVESNSEAAENGSNLWTLYNSFTSAITHSIDKNGNELSDKQKELYGTRINSVILKLAKAA